MKECKAGKEEITVLAHIQEIDVSCKRVQALTGGRKRETESNGWIIDSGASVHMCKDKSMFTGEPIALRKRVLVRIGDGTTLVGTHVGNIVLELGDKRLRLEKVLFVPQLKCNLFSIGSCTKLGHSVHFKRDEVELLRSDGSLFGTGYREGDLWWLRIGSIIENAFITTCETVQDNRKLVNCVEKSTGNDENDQESDAGANQAKCEVSHVTEVVAIAQEVTVSALEREFVIVHFVLVILWLLLSLFGLRQVNLNKFKLGEDVEISLIVWFGFDLTRWLGGILLSRYVRKFWRVHGKRDAYRQRELNVHARDADSRRFARTLFVRDGLVRRRDIDSYARLCGACQRRGRLTRSTRTTRNYTSVVVA